MSERESHTEERKVFMGTYVTDEFRQRYEQLAKRMDRSIAAEMRRGLEAHLERHEQKAEEVPA